MSVCVKKAGLVYIRRWPTQLFKPARASRMDDPEIWSAIHRMANVLERLKMDRAAGMGVVMDAKSVSDTYDAKITATESWLNDGKEGKAEMQKTMTTLKTQRDDAVTKEKILSEAVIAFDKAAKEKKTANDNNTAAASALLKTVKTFNTELVAYRKAHLLEAAPSNI